MKKNMDYDLAKKLKDAGFPQWNFQKKGDRFCKGTKKECYIPTLSELIDFVDGSDKLKDIEDDYVQKALFKLQKGESK